MFRPLTKRDKIKERKLTMQNMLGVSLCEVRGLFKDLVDKLCGEDQQKWLEALKHFLRGEPVWAEEMIYTPLEWSSNFGDIHVSNLQDCTSLFNEANGGGWKIPTLDELGREMKKRPEGFINAVRYWTCTDCTVSGRSVGKGLLMIDTRDRTQTCLYYSNDSGLVPHLRLCRPIRLPE